MIENQLGSSQDDNSHDQLVPGEFPEQASDPPITQMLRYSRNVRPTWVKF